jgi:hypothetical protein
MRNLTNLVLIVVLVVSTEVLYAGSQAQNEPAPQQGGEQNATPEQQPHATSSAAVRSETGCLVRSDSGYSLKTSTDTIAIETSKDLSQYVNKKIKVTGILEHHSATASSATNGPVAITDLRLRLVASVVGDCDQASK